MLSFIELCLKKNPKKRGSTNELLEHEFLKDVNTTECQLQMIELIKSMKKDRKSNKFQNLEERKEDIACE